MWSERTEKVEHTNTRYEDMILFSTQKNKIHSREGDIVLLLATHKIGYGNWKLIRKHIRRESRGRFDHILLTRTETELKKRVDLLIKSIEKEARDDITSIKSIEVKDILKMKQIYDECQQSTTNEQKEEIETDSDQRKEELAEKERRKEFI